jgi:hypothetical protein
VCPGAFAGGAGALSEIDRALALIGTACWAEQYNTNSRRALARMLDTARIPRLRNRGTDPVSIDPSTGRTR